MSPTFQLLLDPPEDTQHGEAVRNTAEAIRASGPSDAKEFLAVFRRAVKLEPNDPDYHYMLGDALARLGRFQEALPALREAIQMSPAEGAYCHALGAALWSLGRYEEAAQALGEASRLKPDHLPTLTALGATLAALERYRESVRALHKAIRQPGPLASTYNNLGVALWGLGRRSDSLRAFRRACQLEPGRLELHRNLAQALTGSGRDDEAHATLRQAIRSRPDDPAPYLDLAELLYAGGNAAAARETLAQALALDPACLRGRPASREAYSALRLDELRAELAPETRQAAGSSLWSALYALLLGAGGMLRRLAPPLGSLGTALWFIGLAVAVRAAWCLLPPYFDYYVLKDRIAEAAGAPLAEDSDVQERILHAVREQGLEARVREEHCQIETRPRWRTIRCEYEHPVEIVPGFERSLRFRIAVERPYLAPDKTIFH